MRPAIVAALLALALAGCSGGSSVTVQPASTPAQSGSGNTAVIESSITVQAAQAQQMLSASTDEHLTKLLIPVGAEKREGRQKRSGADARDQGKLRSLPALSQSNEGPRPERATGTAA